LMLGIVLMLGIARVTLVAVGSLVCL